MACLLKNFLLKTQINRINLLSFRRSAHPFPQFENLPPFYPVSNTGSVYDTKIKRKRHVIDPNVPNFEKGEPLRWSDWRMLRDVRRRYVHARYWPHRMFVYCIQKCRFMPSIIQERGLRELKTDFPREARTSYMTNRCVISSRPRGKLKRYRISRHFWRNLADYNLLSGVMKSCWGP